MRRRGARAVIAEAEPVATVEATADLPAEEDVSAMSDPENAHSPMSPDDQVSNEHTGLHEGGHSTGGTTPAS
jgi:hypothetical protein